MKHYFRYRKMVLQGRATWESLETAGYVLPPITPAQRDRNMKRSDEPWHDFSVTDERPFADHN